MSLAALRQRIPVHVASHARVDLWDLTEPPGKEGAGDVLVFREPGVDRLYQAIEDLPKYRRRNPLSSQDRAFQTLILAQCHAEPEAENNVELMEFYEHMAQNNAPAFLRCVTTVYAAFPWIISLFGAAEEKKGS